MTSIGPLRLDRLIRARAIHAMPGRVYRSVGLNADRIAAVIRNGLSNGPIAQSQAAWDCLQTRLGEIARAILEEI